MTPKTSTSSQEISAAMLAKHWQQSALKLVTLAEAFPEAKYEVNFADGVRTVGDVLRHVAFWNAYLADSIRGQKADDAANELAKSEYATKARVMDALKRSATDAGAAIAERSALPEEAAELVLGFIEHTSEHYGQLVVYARMSGIVPPASVG
jgi:uncharacterized damage-inducible protein DinB